MYTCGWNIYRFQTDGSCVTYICGEGIQEGNERGCCWSWLDVEDGNTEVKPGDCECEGIGPGGGDGDVCNHKVSHVLMNFSQHAIPVSRTCFTSILKI